MSDPRGRASAADAEWPGRPLPPRRTHYEVLMVHPAADTDVVATVYRRLAKRFHPDRDPSPEARTRMAELNEAYGVLRDPLRRADYDAGLRAAGRLAADLVPGRPGWTASTELGEAPASPFGEAGPPPSGPTAGSTLSFGRYRGWTLGQVARVDRDFLEWLARSPAGRAYRHDLSTLLGGRRG